MAGPVKWIALLMATPAYSYSERAADSVSSARLKEPFSHNLLCGNFLFRNIGRYPSSATAPTAQHDAVSETRIYPILLFGQGLYGQPILSNERGLRAF